MPFCGGYYNVLIHICRALSYDVYKKKRIPKIFCENQLLKMLLSQINMHSVSYLL
jgi:hypothetical protein